MISRVSPKVITVTSKVSYEKVGKVQLYFPTIIMFSQVE